MLQVTNGIITILVTKGAYNSFYKHSGFHTVNGSLKNPSTEEGFTHPSSREHHSDNSTQLKWHDSEVDDETTEVNETEVDLSEIPLSEMSFAQLEEYADQLELDHEGVRSKKELRIRIRRYLKS